MLASLPEGSVQYTAEDGTLITVTEATAETEIYILRVALRFRRQLRSLVHEVQEAKAAEALASAVHHPHGDGTA